MARSLTAYSGHIKILWNHTLPFYSSLLLEDLHIRVLLVLWELYGLLAENFMPLGTLQVIQRNVQEEPLVLSPSLVCLVLQYAPPSNYLAGLLTQRHGSNQEKTANGRQQAATCLLLPPHRPHHRHHPHPPPSPTETAAAAAAMA